VRAREVNKSGMTADSHSQEQSYQTSCFEIHDELLYPHASVGFAALEMGFAGERIRNAN
jgi:hypothetical protein